MGVLFNTAVLYRREVIVYDVHDIADVNAAGCHASRNEDGRLARSEGSHSSLSFNLSAVTMDGGDWQLHIEQKIIERVGSLTTVDKDDGTNTIHLFEKSQKSFILPFTIDFDNHLLDILCGAAGTTNSEAHM